MYLPVSGIEPTSSVFLGECVTRSATVAHLTKKIQKVALGLNYVPLNSERDQDHQKYSKFGFFR